MTQASSFVGPGDDVSLLQGDHNNAGVNKGPGASQPVSIHCMLPTILMITPIPVCTLTKHLLEEHLLPA